MLQLPGMDDQTGVAAVTDEKIGAAAKYKPGQVMAGRKIKCGFEVCAVLRLTVAAGGAANPEIRQRSKGNILVQLHGQIVGERPGKGKLTFTGFTGFYWFWTKQDAGKLVFCN